MDTATLYVAAHVLTDGAIRSVARRLGRPPSSVEAALGRLEEHLSLILAERAGSGLNVTLEARRIVPLLDRAARCIGAMHTLGSGKGEERPAQAAIGLEALARLEAVAQAGSIRKAARELQLGQPQLTRQMRGVEQALGVPVLTRAADGARLTREGKVIVDLSAELQDVWNELSARSGERFRRTLATARLGSVMPLGHESQIAKMLADLAVRWQGDHRRQPLFISSTTADDLLAGLKSGRFDAVLLDTMEVPADCEGELIATASLALVGHQRLFGATLPETLARAPVAVPSARSGLRQQFDRLLRETRAEPLRIVEIDSIPVILNLVLAHGYLSLLPEVSIASVRAELGSRRIEAQQKLWLCWPKTAAARQIGQQIAAMLPAG